jgi:flagellar motor switch protein FliM
MVDEMAAVLALTRLHIEKVRRLAEGDVIIIDGKYAVPVTSRGREYFLSFLEEAERGL